MNRFLASALVLSSFSVFAFVGCEDTSKVKSTTEATSPTGSTKVEETKTVKESGSNPPPVEAPK